MLRDVAKAKPQAIVTFCTNFPAAPIVPEMEHELGIPIYDAVTMACGGPCGEPASIHARASTGAGVRAMNPESDSLLIRGAHVLTLDDADHEWPSADIVIEDGRIAAVGPTAGAAWPRPFARTIEGRGLLAMPGLINAHFHSPGNLMKGALPGYPLEIFMLHEVPPLAPTGGAGRLAYVRTMIGALEMLRRGVTAVHDDAYHVPVASVESIDAIMQAYADAGIRATVAIDQPNIVEYEKYPYLPRCCRGRAPRDGRGAAPVDRRAAGALRPPDRALARCRERTARRRGVLLGAAARDRRLLRRLSALSKRHDLPFNIHILETKLQRVLGARSSASRWCAMCTTWASSTNA